MAAGDKAFSHDYGVSFESLKKFVKPRHNFMETESLQEVLQLIPTCQILHIHGMPSSGKSQILAATCKKLDDNPSRIIWHVQCQKRTGALKRELLDLAANLRQHGFISAEVQGALGRALHREGGERYQVREMMNFLDEINLKLTDPLLLVVEDIAHDDEKNLLRNLISCMGDFDCSILKIQLLVATKDKNSLYSQQELDAFDMYRTFHIHGFSGKEAREFLNTERLQIRDEAKVEKLADELAYSPLGLEVVKSYCEKYRMTYEDFYDSMAKNEDVKGQEDLMEEDRDLRGKSHRYETIRNLLAPRNDEQRIQWRVLRMLALVSKDHIPTQLIKSFFHVSGQVNPRMQETSTRCLVERIEREVNGVVWDIDADEKLIVVHGDILRALRKNLTSEENTELLSDVVRALAALLNKDNRMKKDYVLLHALKNHVEVVSTHCIKHFENLLEGDRNEAKDHEILLGWSKINEVVGFAISQHPGSREGNEEDEFFDRAILCIWTIVCSSFRPSVWFCLRPRFMRRTQPGDQRKFLLDYEDGKDPRKTAKEAYEVMKSASLATETIRELLRNDWEMSYQVKRSDLEGMEERLGDACGINWKRLQQELEDGGSLTIQSKRQLERGKMIVEWDKLNQYYLAERIASIMHSRGRQDNYKGDVISPEMHVRCVWYAELGFHLCDIAAEKIEFKSLFHYILRANNMLPRLVRNRAGENDEDFLKRINESRKMARAVMQDTSDFYEHGIYKLVSGTPFTKMNAMKYLVKANTKVHKRPAVVERFPNSEADEECQELYELCKGHQEVTISTTCLVHAAKYTAARGEYEKALGMFESAFSWGINKKVQSNATTYAWALYNMGRAIVAAGKASSCRQTYVRSFKRKFDLTKNNKTPEKWRNILGDVQLEIL